jgi:hypothetical protein
MPDAPALMMASERAKIPTAKIAIMRWRLLGGFPVAGKCDGSVA